MLSKTYLAQRRRARRVKITLCKITFGPAMLLVVMQQLGGCTTDQKTFVSAIPSADKGSVVYIYRPNNFSNVVISPVLLIDDVERFPVPNAKYTYVYIEPGLHKFKLNLDKHYHGVKELTMDVKRNNTYFLRIDTEMEFRAGEKYKRSFNMLKIPSESGMNEVKEYRYIEPVMPSKYLFGGKTGELDEKKEESHFTIEKTSDPFMRNK